MQAARKDEALYFQARGLQAASPKAVNKAMRLALESMQTTLFGSAATELSDMEQSALQRVGIDIEERPTEDTLLTTAAKFAALIETSLTPNEAAKRLQIAAGRLRQLIADRSIYSLLLERRRYIPLFQFQDRQATTLVPQIARVNRALNPELHPVQVLNWFTLPNPDLFLAADADTAISPLTWLKAGYPVAVVEKLTADL